MHDARGHSDHVQKWLTRAGQGLSSEQLLDLFQQAMNALLSRARVTLGEVTLTAVMDRVLYNASERFVPLKSVRLENNEVICRELRGRRISGSKGVVYILPPNTVA